MRRRCPVGSGPSSNTCPRCEPQFRQRTSVRRMKKLLSERSSTFSVLAGSQKLGHPVPDSNFVFELSRSVPHAAHVWVPSALVWTYLPVNGRSVPLPRRMSYCSGVSSARHSASVFEILVLTSGVYPDWRCHKSSLCGAYSLRNVRRTLAAVLAIGLLSACAGIKAPAASKTDTPQQSLAATGKEMAKLKSVRFDVKGTINLTLPASLVDQLRAKAGSQGSFLSSNMTVDLTISGAVKKPDQLDATIQAKLGGLTVETEVIAAGGRLYAKDPMTGQWKVLGQPGQADSAKSTAGLSYQALIDTAKSLIEINDQPSTIGGVRDHHLQRAPH